MFLRCVAICLSALLATLVARSAILHNYPQKLVQPDGSVVHCYASGDEFHHWLHDAQNYTIVQDSTTGYFVYGVLQNGALSPTTHIVGKVNPEAVGLTPGANIPAAAKQAMRDNALARTGMGWKEASSVGTISNIVIFVRFADEPTTAFPDWIAEFDRMFNSPLPGANSMYNYYREVSYNRLSILSTFYPSAIDSVVSYTDTHPRNYYKKFNAVTNPAGYTTGDEAWAREQTMLASAIGAVSSQVPAGLNIDANNDGFVDNVCFVVSGGVEAWADLLWPHMSSLTYVTAAINGKTVRVYNFQLRNALLDPGNMVYVLAHEMFHSLGAPDLYHYSFQPPDPVGAWDIMNYTGNPPVHMSAYMKWRYGGWISSIPTITTPGTYALAPLLSPTNNCFRIPSIYSSNEFFVVEYRRRMGTFERTLPGEGLLVYRVNRDYNGNADGPPDELYLYRPGGTTTANGTPERAAMSANSGRVALTDSTAPSSFLTDGSPGGLILRDVGFLGDTLSFTIDFPKVPIIALNTRAIYFEPISDAKAQLDTVIVVRNTGYATDSLTTSVSPANVTPDSAIAVFPRSFALAPHDSQNVTISIQVRMLSPGYYNPTVFVHSRFGVGQKTLSTMLDFEKIATDAKEAPGLPREFALDQNYPNPFNPSTTIRYALPARSHVTLTIFNTLGQQVATLVEGEVEAGYHEVQFDASRLSSGVYLYRLTAGSFVETRKLVLVR